jgi:hypothetical protein
MMIVLKEIMTGVTTNTTSLGEVALGAEYVTLQVNPTSTGGGSINVALEGSINGTTWYSLKNHTYNSSTPGCLYIDRATYGAFKYYRAETTGVSGTVSVDVWLAAIGKERSDYTP